jgi:2-polyprenyl-6-methoxyphenol hydroxylase-like FAD-dependent oxidoreductase
MGTRDHAIVCGGSMGGLLAARVLSDHYRRVTIVDSDVFPACGEARRGVPQGRHTHGLLASGRDVIERLFPGISAELVAAGAVAGDIVKDARWFNAGGRLAHFRSGLEGLLLTRPMLEGFVRGRTFAVPNIEVRADLRVESLTATADRQRVTGIAGGGSELAADLVVDATGRASHAPQWLQALGYEAPAEERVEVALAYTTRFFRRRPEHLGGDTAAVIPPDPGAKRGGVMLAQEGDRWTVTLIGYFGQAAPPELDGFVEYARTLPAPYIYEVVREAEPLGDAMSARFPASQRRRYERLKRFPKGFLVFGDAISSFNPIYGQGMSVSALEAEVLAAEVALGTDGDLARRFFRRAAAVVDIPWSISVGNDLRMPETVGPRNAGVSFINWYMSRLHRAAHSDPAVAMAFFRVANLLAPPPSVMAPRVAWRVLKGNLRRAPAPGDAAQVRATSSSRGAL